MLQTSLFSKQVLFFIVCMKICPFSAELMKKRSAPFLLYPTATSAGVAVAIAIPVSDDENNLFVSYNFEINYNVVNTAPESIPGPLKRLKLASNVTGARTTNNQKYLLTRIGVYRVIKSVMDA